MQNYSGYGQGIAPELNGHLQQHLRSIIIHSIDNLNYKNAEFASERLLALDPENLDAIYLYCLSLYHQQKYKSCYHKLVDSLSTNHLGCSYIFAKCCLHLKKYKEGVFQLTKVEYLFNETCSHSTNYFNTVQQKHYYELKRSTLPDSSTCYHLLGDLFRGLKDTTSCTVNYIQALRFNPYDFEAFQKLCNLGVNLHVKSIYNQNQSNNIDQSYFEDVANPFAGSNDNHHEAPDYTFPSTPNIPLRKNNLNTQFEFKTIDKEKHDFGKLLHDFNNKHHELNKHDFNSFTKPLFPDIPRSKGTYSKITSRLISQPKKKEERVLKRNSIDTSLQEPKEIEQCDKYLLQLYTIFAKSYKSMSKYDCYKAIKLLESLPEREKETSWVLSKMGKLHYEIVNYKTSEVFFQKLRKLDRTRLEDMEYYSTLLWHLHKKVELTYLANELYNLDPDSSITWCVIGNLFSLTRESEESIKAFNKSIKLNEDFTYAYTLKGHEYFSNDNYEMALENFRHSLLIDLRHYNAFYGIGMVYVNLGDYLKADFHFKKAVSINPINIILICCVGMVLEKLNKKNLALRQYELAGKLQPLNPLPMFKKAQLLFSMEQFPEALELFEVLKDLAPDEASVHYLLGQLYNIQDDKYQAIREFTIALNLDPKGNYLIREAMESLKEK